MVTGLALGSSDENLSSSGSILIEMSLVGVSTKVCIIRGKKKRIACYQAIPLLW